MAGPNVDFRITGDEKLLQRALARSEREVDKLKGKLRGVGAAGKTTGGELNHTFGPSFKQLMGLAAGAGGVGLVITALRSVVGLAQEVKQEIKEALSQFQQIETPAKYLWQISESKRHYRQMSGGARLAMAREGMGFEESAGLRFILRSLGAEEGLDAVIKTARFMQPDVAADFYARLTAPAAFGKAWSPEQVLSGLVKGAEISAFNVGQTAGWVPRTIAGMRQLGATPAEILGVGATISPLTANPEMLATQMDRLAAVMDKEGYGGGGILAGLARWRKEDPESYEVAKQANIRFKRAALALEPPEAVSQAMMNTALIEQQMQVPTAYEAKIRTPPELTQLQRMRVGKLQKEIALEDLGAKQGELELTIDRAKALAAYAGTSLTMEKGWEKALQAGATIGQVSKATELAQERYLENVYKAYPDLFREYAAGVFPSPTFDRYGYRKLPPARTRKEEFLRSMGTKPGYEWAPMPSIDLPGPITTEEQQGVLSALANAIAAQNIGERFELDAQTIKDAVRDGVREGFQSPALGKPDQEPP